MGSLTGKRQTDFDRRIKGRNLPKHQEEQNFIDRFPLTSKMEIYLSPVQMAVIHINMAM